MIKVSANYYEKKLYNFTNKCMGCKFSVDAPFPPAHIPLSIPAILDDTLPGYLADSKFCIEYTALF